jgi:glycosyltransferase involved in cell wall biosynthesis
MHAGKGHHDLLEAARSLASENINFTVCFAGAVDSETLHRELRTLVAATGLENRTLFLGDQSAAEMRRLYARSNMVVLPSASEGLPRVLLEAQAMKKPVVAYDSGGVSETMLPNESGFLVKRGDVRALTDRMRFLLTHADERLRMGELARAFVCERFGVESLTRRHEAFYLSTLAPRFAASSQRTPLQERRVTPACVGAQSIEPE